MWISVHDGRATQRTGAPLILIVEDDPLILSMVRETLEEEGYEAATAPHGAAALEYLARRQQTGTPPPALILLDMRMPVMDGWAFAEAYRWTPGPHAPIVVMTAAHDSAARAAAIGAAAVLSKPFDMDELVALVDQCLGVRRPVDRRASRE